MVSAEGVDLDKLDNILEQIEKRERIARKRAVVYTIIPILMAILLLAYTSYQIKSSANQLQHMKEALEKTKGDLKATEERLRDATDIERDIVYIDWEDIKVVAVWDPKASTVFRAILDNNKVKWTLGGKSPTEGFDSPRYAAYILDTAGYKQFSYLLQGEDKNVRQELLRRLNCSPASRQFTLRDGDLIFYRRGFVMFYFSVPAYSAHSEESRERELVIGMTPQGVVSLRKDFASIESICRLP